MLGTNAVSALVRGRTPALQAAVLGRAHCISVVTEAELLFGLARRPEARNVALVVHAFLQATPVLPWTSVTAASYAKLRAALKRTGQGLSALDLMIAAHALAEGCTLATSDHAFMHVPGLEVLDWTGA